MCARSIAMRVRELRKGGVEHADVVGGGIAAPLPRRSTAARNSPV